jgi:hypothetical protein
MASREASISAGSSEVQIKMLKRLSNLGWVLAFVALCAFYVSQVVRATHRSGLAKETTEGAPWICPIAGKCGPAGTPGLGRW